jgi:hypothetical protein
MLKKFFFIACFIVPGSFAWSENTRTDTIPVPDDLAIDTSIDYDALLSDLDLFLDSLLSPRSFFLADVSAANGYFVYKARNNTRGIETKKKLILTPTIGYYHKSGPGITASANIINGQTNHSLYQYSITPSFDFIQSKKWVAGVSYTRHFTKDSLPFYTTPLQNEVAGYYLLREPWLQPGLSLSYGWGGRTDLKQRKDYITVLKIRKWISRNGIHVVDTLRYIDSVYTTITTKQSISDFLLTATLRHTFYWLDVLGKNDCLKFTPMLAFSFGTQKFGFNQTTATTATVRNTGNVQFNRGDVNLDQKRDFQPVSLTLYLRPEYSIGKFFIQPQFMIDYYFPAEKDNLTTFFSVNAGFIF